MVVIPADVIPRWSRKWVGRVPGFAAMYSRARASTSLTRSPLRAVSIAALRASVKR